MFSEQDSALILFSLPLLLPYTSQREKEVRLGTTNKEKTERDAAQPNTANITESFLAFPGKTSVPPPRRKPGGPIPPAAREAATRENFVCSSIDSDMWRARCLRYPSVFLSSSLFLFLLISLFPFRLLRFPFSVSVTSNVLDSLAIFLRLVVCVTLISLPSPVSPVFCFF